MSRTIRRRHIKQGTRYWDTSWFVDRIWDPETWTYTRIPILKEKEPKRWKQAWHKCHAESSHAKERSPDKYYRSKREREHRTSTRTELAKWFRDPTHEVLINDNPIDCHWDWS